MRLVRTTTNTTRLPVLLRTITTSTLLQNNNKTNTTKLLLNTTAALTTIRCPTSTTTTTTAVGCLRTTSINTRTCHTETTTRKAPRILVTGGLGQIGTELIPRLRERYGPENVIATDVRKTELPPPFFYLDILKISEMERLVVENNVDWLIHNASILSAAGERNPHLALDINIQGFQNALEVARRHNLRILSPSSIAAFGPSTPRDFTPDETIMRPTTIYGVTKLYGELMGEYYQKKFGVDFRSLRYPGVLSYVALPGGGTTDYAVDIFYKALQEGRYQCFLGPDTALPMMYMPDCLKATVDLLEAPKEKLTQRVYNVTAMSFTPDQLARAIQKRLKNFQISYQPDFRQAIADSWPRSLNDEKARADWGWKPEYDLDAMVDDMLARLKIKLGIIN